MKAGHVLGAGCRWAMLLLTGGMAVIGATAVEVDRKISCRFLLLDAPLASAVYLALPDRTVHWISETRRPTPAVSLPSMEDLQLVVDRREGGSEAMHTRILFEGEGSVRHWLVCIGVDEERGSVAYCVPDPLHDLERSGVWIINRSGYPLVVQLGSHLQPIRQHFSQIDRAAVTGEEEQKLRVFVDMGDGWQTGLSAHFVFANNQKWLLLIDRGQRLGAPLQVKRIYLNDRKATCQQAAADA